MAIKFSQLPTTSTLATDDLFVVTDVSENTSLTITFGDLKNVVVDAGTFTDNASNMVSALNAYTQAGTSPKLNAGTVGGFDTTHLLNYNNLNNKPTINPDTADLHDFDNSKDAGGFVKFVNDGVNSTLRFDLVSNKTTLSQTNITTSYIGEGTNLYYTDNRVEQFFDANFASYFNTYSTTFDQGEINDSYFDTVGFAAPGTIDGANLGKTIRIKNQGQIPGMSADFTKRSQTGRFASYSKGKVVRLFGADSAERTDLVNQLNVTGVATGFTTVSDANAGITPTFVPGNVIVAQSQITLTNHGLTEGDDVIYSSGTGTAVGGLTSGTTYYIIVIDSNTIQLASSYANATAATAVPITLSAGATGSAHTLTPIVIANPYQRITYSVAEWDMNTGQIAPAATAVGINVSVPATTPAGQVSSFLQADQEAILKAFSVENFVKLSFTHTIESTTTSGVSPNRGLAIYRRISQVNTTDTQLQGVSKLIAVLGPKDVLNNTWIDYYTDDILDFSEKDQSDNSYLPLNTVHFKPSIEPSSAQKGWVDATIASVKYEDEVNPSLSTYIDVTLESNVKLSSGETNGVWISHNDTTAIQTAITTNSGRGQKAVRLNPKNYVVSELTVPDNFTIEGFAYNTKLTRLPWSGWFGSSSASSARILKASSLQNTSFVGFDIDGNAVNSIMFDDTNTLGKNFAIDCGQASNAVLLDKIRLSSPIGGGIFASDGKNLKAIACEVVNSGVTDRHLYSPLIVDGGENTSISSNRFENFTESLNASVTNKGVVEGNIISNCGSGLLMFGSRFMITSPNVLTGPAGEFLPQPDSFNSEFDSINIDLTSASIAASDFNSGPFKYQENGEVYDLSTSGVTYKMFAIKKPSGGEESIWIENLLPPGGVGGTQNDKQTIIETLDASTAGNFNTSTDEITLTAHAFFTGDPVKYLENGGSFAPLTSGTTYFVNKSDPNKVKLYDTQANAILGGSPGRVNINTTSGSGTGHTFTRSVYLEMREGGESDNPPSQGGFQFTLPAESVRRTKIAGQQYTVDYMKNASNTIFHIDANGNPSSSAGDPDHVGIGWSGIVTQFVLNGIIENDPSDPAIWSATYTENAKQYADYTVKVSDYKYLAIGRKVRPTAAGATAHDNFSAGDVANNPASYGVIKSFSGSEALQTVVIQWENANIGGTATVGSGGTLEAENSFVIATGRIK